MPYEQKYKVTSSFFACYLFYFLYLLLNRDIEHTAQNRNGYACYNVP